MATSGTTTFNPVRDVIVKGALRLVGAYASSESPRPEQLTDAIEALDLMLKGWQVDGYLWLKKFIYVTLVAAKNYYDIGVGSSDGIFTNADGTGAYTQRPVKIYDPTRYASDGAETPLPEPLSRSDWAALPNKTTTGTVVQVYYDPQLVMGRLWVWPTPMTGVTDKIKLTVDRIIEDVGSDEKTLDVPPEYLETVKYQLALRLSPEYPPGMSVEDKKLALALKDKMDSVHRENVSTFFQPGR